MNISRKLATELVEEAKKSGKKVVFFGDSITEQGYYVDAFKRLTGCIVVNRGRSGTSYAKTDAHANSLSERVDLPSSDAVGGALGLPSRLI